MRKKATKLNYAFLLSVLGTALLTLSSSAWKNGLFLNLATVELQKWRTAPTHPIAADHLERAVCWGERALPTWEERGYAFYADLSWRRATNPVVLDQQESRLLYRQGHRLESEGHPKLALEEYLQAVALDPRCIMCTLDAYRLASKLGSQGLSERLIASLVSLSPEYATTYEFDSGLELLGLDLDEYALERDVDIPLTLYWHYPDALTEDACPDSPVCVIDKGEWVLLYVRDRVYQYGLISNLLRNGGFEANLPSTALIPTGFQSLIGRARFQDDPAGFLRAHYSLTAEDREGSISQVARIENTEALQSNGIVPVAPIPVTPEEVYLAVGWLRVDGQARGFLGGVWRTSVSTNVQYSYVAREQQNPSWQYFAGMLSPPDTAVSFTFLALNKGKGSVYFDNLLLAQIPTPAPLN